MLTFEEYNGTSSSISRISRLQKLVAGCQMLQPLKRILTESENWGDLVQQTWQCVSATYLIFYGSVCLSNIINICLQSLAAVTTSQVLEFLFLGCILCTYFCFYANVVVLSIRNSITRLEEGIRLILCSL